MIQTAIHKGPMLRHIDARMITNPASSAMPWIWRRSWASPCRRACAPAALPTARPSICPTRGVPVIVIGIPVRYIHTHYGIAAHSDVENAARLAAPFWSGWTAAAD